MRNVTSLFRIVLFTVSFALLLLRWSYVSCEENASSMMWFCVSLSLYFVRGMKRILIYCLRVIACGNVSLVQSIMLIGNNITELQRCVQKKEVALCAGLFTCTTILFHCLVSLIF